MLPARDALMVRDMVQRFPATFSEGMETTGLRVPRPSDAMTRTLNGVVEQVLHEVRTDASRLPRVLDEAGGGMRTAADDVHARVARILSGAPPLPEGIHAAAVRVLRLPVGAAVGATSDDLRERLRKAVAR